MVVNQEFNREKGHDFVYVALPSSGSLDVLFDTPKRRLNLLRRWRALPRLQRSIISVFFGFLICMIVYLVARRKIVYPVSENPVLERLVTPDYFNGQPDAVVPTEDTHQALKFPGPKNERQAAVAKAFIHAWDGYKTYAWGHDHLKSTSKGHHDWFGLGLTIVDSIDTMVIMGLNDQYEEARTWIENDLKFTSNRYVNLFEVTIRVLGGLLSAYHLTGDRMFATKAEDLAGRLMGAFNTPSHIPFSDVNLNLKKGKSPAWSSDSSLSEVTTIQMEFRDVSRITGKPSFENAAFATSLAIHKQGCAKTDGLCPMFLNPKTGQFRESTITMGARADSYYEYLLKQWLQTGKSIDWLRQDYEDAMKATRKHLWGYSEPHKYAFVGELLGDKSFHPKMDHLVCFLAGTLALGSHNGLSEEHMDWAQELAHTCFRMYNNTLTGLSPEIAYFNILPGDPKKEDIIIKPLDAHYILRPETVESFFYLYRFTGDTLYQDYGWTIFQAIEKHAKTPVGYASIANVKKVPVTRRDMMESFFLAETLKYLYLLFDDDRSLVSLDEFVFNTEGHPLPILR